MSINNIIVGAIIGIAVGYTIKKCQDKEFFNKMTYNISRFGIRAKMKFKNVTQYIRGNIEDEIDNNNGTLNEISY